MNLINRALRGARHPVPGSPNRDVRRKKGTSTDDHPAKA